MQKQWKAMCSMAVMSLVAGAAFAGPIYLDSSGREWLDVNDTRFRSWNDAAAVCNAVTGDCSGVLATSTVASSDIDITGYRWATRNEVRDLFYEAAGLPPGSLDSFTASFPIAAGYGTTAFGVFEPTIQFDWGPAFENVLNGVTRDTYVGADSLVHGYSGIIHNPPFASDTFTITGGLATDIREISMGVFLYRTAPAPVPVPEPDTLVLFAAALVSLLFVRRRQRGAPADAR
jgi:hypothetical protein